MDEEVSGSMQNSITPGAQTKGPKTKRLPDKRAKKHRQKGHRQKGQKSRQKGQKPKLYFNCFSMKNLFFQCNKTDLELDLFEAYLLLAYLLYGSVASLPSPSSNIEAWPYGTYPRFASLLHLGH